VAREKSDGDVESNEGRGRGKRATRGKITPNGTNERLTVQITTSTAHKLPLTSSPCFNRRTNGNPPSSPTLPAFSSHPLPSHGLKLSPPSSSERQLSQRQPESEREEPNADVVKSRPPALDEGVGFDGLGGVGGCGRGDVDFCAERERRGQHGWMKGRWRKMRTNPC
jgi:hypothetical protein